MAMARPLGALCLIAVCAGIALPREAVTSRPEVRTAPRQVAAAPPRPASSSAVVRKLTSLEQHAEERERQVAERADYSLPDTLTPDPEATATGEDRDPREVFSGHYVPVKPTPLPDPALAPPPARSSGA